MYIGDTYVVLTVVIVVVSGAAVVCLVQCCQQTVGYVTVYQVPASCDGPMLLSWVRTSFSMMRKRERAEGLPLRVDTITSPFARRPFPASQSVGTRVSDRLCPYEARLPTSTARSAQCPLGQFP